LTFCVSQKIIGNRSGVFFVQTKPIFVGFSKIILNSQEKYDSENDVQSGQLPLSHSARQKFGPNSPYPSQIFLKASDQAPDQKK
jgi:hypothetical protein